MLKLRVSRTKQANLQVSPNKFCCISQSIFSSKCYQLSEFLYSKFKFFLLVQKTHLWPISLFRNPNFGHFWKAILADTLQGCFAFVLYNIKKLNLAILLRIFTISKIKIQFEECFFFQNFLLANLSYNKMKFFRPIMLRYWLYRMAL